MVKYIFTLVICVWMACGFLNCSRDSHIPENSARIFPEMLDGTWMLTRWNDAPLQEGQYVYITFTHHDHTFLMYDNMNSMYSHCRSGFYSMEQDEENVFVLTGEYNYDMGEWGSYVVTEITSRHMVLIKTGFVKEISVYTRTEGVPSDIEEGSRVMQGEQF